MTGTSGRAFLAARWLGTALACFACTDARLYGKNFEPNVADRISFQGELCTDDPSALDFPVKVLVVMDTSGVDPNGNRVAALRALLDKYQGANRYFSILQLGAQTRPLTKGFAADSSELDTALASISTTIASPQRNYLDALRLLSTIVEDDVIASNPGQRSRTRYVVLFVAQGAPAPGLRDYWCPANGLDPASKGCADRFVATFCSDQTPAPADCERYLYARLLTDLRKFVQDNGAQDLVFHSFLVGTDARAHELLSDMALAGRGAAVEAPIDKLNLLGVDILKPGSRFLLREFMVYNQNALLRGARPVADSDGDGLTDPEEVRIGTSPLRPDTDEDGVGDALERALSGAGGSFDPLVPGKPKQCASLSAPYPDSDLDGLNDCEEAVIRTSPFLADTDRDGIPDNVEALRGGNPLVDDRLTDSDQDGIPNGEELKRGLDLATNDASREPEFGYHYSVVDEGATVRLEATPPDPLPGLRVVSVTGTAGGVGLLRLNLGPPMTLAWSENVASVAVGTPVDVSRPGVFTLASPSNGRVDVEVDPALLRTAGAQDVRLFVRPTLRTCFHADVRSVTLVETQEVPAGRPGRGWNLLSVYVAEVPEESPNGATIYRALTVPVRFLYPDKKMPDNSFIQLEQNDFVLLAPK